jgi:DNA-binding MarR family transcriptional regulator
MASLKSSEKSNEYSVLALKFRILSTIILKCSRRDIEERLRKKGIAISIPAVAVMRLVRNNVTTIRDLSKRMLIAPATLVPIIDGLERKNLLSRGTDAKDRRKNNLSITDRGVNLLSRINLTINEDLLTKSMVKIGTEKSSRVVKELEELATLLSEDKKICEHVSELVKKETNLVARGKKK